MDKVSVIPIGVSALFRCAEAEETSAVLERYGIRRPYILYLGSSEPRKNLRRLVEAFAQLNAWAQEWTLVIAGSQSWQTAPLMATIQHLKLEQRLQFPGAIADRDLPALYRGADLFVFPSLFEGFGLPVLEAMACATPVVTSTVSSLPEIVGDAGILVDPYDTSAIAAGMRRLLEDRGLAFELAARGVARARRFTWERTARETAAVYEEIRGRSSAVPSGRRDTRSGK